MLDKVPTLKLLLQHLQQVPFLASRNVYKVASYFLDMEPHKVAQFSKVLQQAKENVIRCTICFVWIEKNNACMFCASKNRDEKIICVIESWQDMLSIERTEGFKGMYHVLGGVISPLDGITPERLTINALLFRMTSQTQEIILALNQTPEGEATSSFVAQQIHKNHPTVSISCLAKGVPVGASLEFIDRLTVSKALSERRPF